MARSESPLFYRNTSRRYISRRARSGACTSRSQFSSRWRQPGDLNGLTLAMTQPAAPLRTLLQPHITLLARTPTQAVHARLMSTLFTPLLGALSRASPLLDDNRPAKRQKEEAIYAHLIMGCTIGDAGSEERATPDDLRRGVLKAMFDAAADGRAVESNRRKMYKLWREEADHE